jgi:hypothetical protein
MSFTSGVPLDEAFRQFSGRAAIQELERRDQLLEQCEARRRSGQPTPELRQLGGSYRELWVQLHEAFIAALRSGRLIASAFRTPLSPHSRREMISFDLWELLDVETDHCRATAKGIEFIRIEIVLGLNRARGRQEGPSAPSAKPRPEFEHNEDFTRVRIREHAFELSSQLAKVVQRYHEASLGPDPALPAKVVLGELGFKSECLASVFNRRVDPSWRELLTPTARRGSWRLNLQDTPTTRT